MIAPQEMLRAMRADSVPEGLSGLWAVTRKQIEEPLTAPDTRKRPTMVPPGIYTSLWRFTMAELHKEPPGECVMNDMEAELRTHLDFCLRARGNVLVTGLGLGCVARGLLANPAVHRVTVIERDQHVLKLVRPHLPAGLRIILADAVAWCAGSRETFDCAWHDLWSDPDKDEPALQLNHGRMIVSMARQVGWQGAWMFPREIRKLLRSNDGVELI